MKTILILFSLLVVLGSPAAALCITKDGQTRTVACPLGQAGGISEKRTPLCATGHASRTRSIWGQYSSSCIAVHSLAWELPKARVSPIHMTMNQFASILNEKGTNPYFTASQVRSGKATVDSLKILQTKNIEHPYIGLYHHLAGSLFNSYIASSKDLKSWATIKVIRTASSMPDAVILPDNSVLYAEERNPSRNRPYIQVSYYKTFGNFISHPESPTATINLPRTPNATADGTPQFGRITYSGDIYNSRIEISYHFFKDSRSDQNAVGTLTNFRSWSGSTETWLNDSMAMLGYAHIGDREYFEVNGSIYLLIEANPSEPSRNNGWDKWDIFLINKSTRQIRELFPKIAGGAHSIGNPSGSFVTLPDGRSALAVSYFLFREGAGSTPPGPHVYVYPLNSDLSPAISSIFDWSPINLR
jgi:hypothetical protein